MLDCKKLSLVYTHKTVAMTLSDILVGEGEGLVLMELNAYYYGVYYVNSFLSVLFINCGLV